MQFHLFLSLALAASTYASPILPRQQDYATGLLRKLNESDCMTLSLVLERLFTTDQGRELVSALQQGEHTLLAPNDSAMDPAVLTEEPEALAAVISYHVINGSFPASAFAPPRTHSVAPTRLTNTNYVNMGGAPQVQVLEQGPGGDGLLVRQTTGNGTVTSSTAHENLVIHTLSSVLMPPGDMKFALSSPLVGRAQGGFPQLGGALQKVGLLEEWNNEASVTVFAPIDDAFTAIEATVAGLSNDQLSSVLRNHIINGRVIYSDDFESTPSATAASGAQLNFSNEGNVLYVTHGQNRARVMRSDVAIKNGVLYVLDAVLA
ncbi:Fasciclin domain-containing protein [Ceratobasidium sp. AG-Ba]|nr:Fasciclin domain-containing protein [Ceratobasidium sp. AG-Ba]QRW02587.1 Fasciclin domain-containing protein [Ceratobasidium sp. AG-Ba]